MADTFRDLCAGLLRGLDENRHPEVRYPGHLRLVMASARAELAKADEPAVSEGRKPAAVTEQPSDEELALIYHDCCRGCEFMDQGGFENAARAVLTRWGNAAPQPPAEGEMAEVMGLFRRWAEAYPDSVIVDPCWLTRAADLLQRQVPVPVSVSDALIKAECALSDIAEGEPMTDEGDPLQWAERRCADTLAIIRPTMRQHKICTSEWPPLPRGR